MTTKEILSWTFVWTCMVLHACVMGYIIALACQKF